MGSLQLAFAALAALQPPIWTTPGGLRQRFELHWDAVEQAMETVHEFEMGRRKRLLLCLGRLYVASCSAVQGRQGQGDWRTLDEHLLWVEEDSEGKYRIAFERPPRVPGLDYDDDDANEDTEAPLAPRISLHSEQLQLQRHWLGDVLGLHPHGGCTAYLDDQPLHVLRPQAPQAACAVVFQVPPDSVPGLNADNGAEEACSSRPISIEVFEAILAMLLLKQGPSGNRLLAEVCDVDASGGLDQFGDAICNLIGPYDRRSKAVESEEGEVGVLSHRLGRTSLDS